ncbi:putative mon2, dimerization and cyclophilin-binding domain, guanine nucleotide exchange factor [Helianthus annuus]|uniref:Mon2, dimerization and cyclophilin-binding domain, guanine nucleotide exchange factor n=2 Tax=Helianthus annuus TaxID=4232 RepID=A0A251T6P7_HELAN|nr:protein MON2 homolog isoform X1 [Helianthus annuus]KAF5791184.1 putative mon2, dimerization and cyclophilin-binding domain, guanine nucleotide exchange factor [Helianthus annuus]KAJ0526298.1 putative mon2, dimerization and cyclophilin-binding domain, guanine nucleotide exchange factor [Helianthus annuus]KAJ0534699.1 putative mon2, dimerization and cyclophilin-binding domain, guanine nucleotide exchange factor [Helianthus annuus]KAJ0542689.1 putative mon2, dimerization and cyclophilin-binding
MAFMAVLESDLRALSAEARRRYPAIKDGAEHAILKLRSLSSSSEIAQHDDILRIFLMACQVKTIKLSVIGLSCLQKLIAHDAVASSALNEILVTLKDHGEMADEGVQLKTLQTVLIIFQSRLQPDSEEHTAQALGICLRLLENNKSSDSVRNTAAATFRQAVALIFDHVLSSEALPAGKLVHGGYVSRSASVTSDVNHSINNSKSLEEEFASLGKLKMRETPTKAGKLGLRLLEDLTALAAGGSASWLRVGSIQRTFALDILEFILSNYVAVFRTLLPYEQVLRHQICSLLMTSLRTNSETEGETGEPYFRRLVLRSVAHIIRHYSSSLITESEVFLSMLVRATSLDLPLWHRILVLEILRGFCVEAHTLRILFQNFDMNPKNTNVVEGMIKALARVVSSVQFQDTSEESLAAVAGMFTSKAKGIEWSLDNDASNAAVLVASEAHAVTLAIEGLLGVVFTVATLTDEAVDVGELESPRCDSDPPAKVIGKTAVLCTTMVDSVWLTILDALSLILTKSQGEAIVLEILKGYQAFTQACGVLRAVEPLNSFLASLCKFTISSSNEPDRKSRTLQSPGSKRTELVVEQRDVVVLTLKNFQALRTLFNITHRLYNVLGPSWVLVLETLAALDRAINSPHATTQEVSAAVSKLTREPSGQYSDFSILSTLNSQLFESSGLMNISAVRSLLSALRQLSYQSMAGTLSGISQTSSQKTGSISFAVERMISILVNNLHRIQPLWDEVVGHFIELANSPNHHLRAMALNALDQSISAVLGSDKFEENALSRHHGIKTEMKALEISIISPLHILYDSCPNSDVNAGSLKILLHVLERHGDKLFYSWPNILEMLRSVAGSSEKDIVTLGFQSLRVIMNDGLSTVPSEFLHVCIDVTGAYSSQKTELNISLTAIGLLWTSTDFIAKGLLEGPIEDNGKETSEYMNGEKIEQTENSVKKVNQQDSLISVAEHDKLLFSVFSLLQNLGADERPEVRNSAVRTLFQTLGSHGQKLSKSMWEDCLWNYVFTTLDRASHMAATSSKDEWHGKELGVHGGKTVHMLIHHSRNTAQKQWDETLVLVFGGIARILRTFFPLLRSITNFWSGWESLLRSVKNSIANGSKEVALAAVGCLQSTVLSHSPKGNLPMPYLKSVLDVYDIVLRNPTACGEMATNKVKQEIIHGLGEVYVHAQGMFESSMYAQLLSIIDSAIKEAKTTQNNFEAEFGHVPPIQRVVLEVFPQLRPPHHLPLLWAVFFQKLLRYLPNSDSSDQNEGDDTKPVESKGYTSDSNGTTTSGQVEVESLSTISDSRKSSAVTITSDLFAEKLVPVLVDMFLQAPATEKFIIFPYIIQGLGRCMITRRENPDGGLWGLAVKSFNQLLVDDINSFANGSRPDVSNSNKPARIRLWKEVADVYEIFLVGYCGRALPSSSLAAISKEDDESLEMELLDVLGDKILLSDIDASPDILERLIITLDRCASRTCSLPVETVELVPPHCSRFSLTCLHKLFSLSCYNESNNWNPTRSQVSKISVMILMARCEYILKKYLTDEKELGERSFPPARIQETAFVLQEMARVVLHPETASVLPLHPFLKGGGQLEENTGQRAHLFVLFSPLCELVKSRNSRVRDLVHTLLRLVSTELGVHKICLTN